MTAQQVIAREIEHQRIRRARGRPVRRLRLLLGGGPEMPLPDDGRPPLIGWALPLRAPLADFVRSRA